jgi:hypothetical protein
VAISAALLGSLVGGYASFKANEALELSRRRARAQIRRKAKIYTPIRLELIALRDAWTSGIHLGTWLIVREEPPPLVRRPASLHLWKDLSEDGRAATAASTTIRSLLDRIDECADTLNQEVSEARAVFGERAIAILSDLGETPHIVNWVESDTAKLLRDDFDGLSLFGGGFGAEVPSDVQKRFRQLWSNDAIVQSRTADVRRVDTALKEALDRAIAALDEAMQRIANKYEKESPHD